MNLPEKMFFKIGEVSQFIKIEPYVLRYWEQEFGFFKPQKNNANHRIYSKQDVLILERIRQLLYEEKYTIDGARKKIKAELAEGENRETGKSPELKQGEIIVSRSFLEDFENLKKELSERENTIRELKREMESLKKAIAESRARQDEFKKELISSIEEINSFCREK
jgi:DNA-binding transcriptional MerR regulator